MVDSSRFRLSTLLYLLLLILFFAGRPDGILAGEDPPPPEQADKEASETQRSEDDERYYQTRQSVPRKVLAAPKYLLVPIKYPSKKALIWFEDADLQNRMMGYFYFNEERTAGWFPNFSFGGKTTVALGAKLFHNDAWRQGKQFKLDFLYGDSDEWELDGLVKSPRFLMDRLTGSIIVRAFEGKEEDFAYDLATGTTGNETTKEDRTSYDIDRFGIKLDLAYQMSEVSEGAVSFDFDIGDVEEGADTSVPPIPTDVEGAYGEAQYYTGGSLRFLYDTRDSDYRATHGWLVHVQSGIRWNVKGTDGEGRDLSHYHWSAEVQRYLRLFSVFRTLLIRAKMTKTEPFSGGDGVPFYQQPTLDENHGLRGFERGRWRDRGALQFNVEYRYPIWDTWDALLFLDEGQVFRDYEDLSMGGFKWSAGPGVRFSGQAGFMFRLTAAWSEEKEPLVLFKMDQAF